MDLMRLKAPFSASFNDETIYDYADIEKLLDIIPADFIRSTKKIEMLNVPCSFDIETTSTYIEGEKLAIMYEWTFGICGYVIIGRYWSQFITLLQHITDYYGLHKNRRLICYVHNLSFEFQFICRRFHWDKVFAIKERTPLTALTTGGIEFRCSYLLSGMSLATLAKNLTTYRCEKMVGDLDYSLIRHAKTPLNAKEIKYCVNDVKVVMAYIMEKIEIDGDISKIPLTKTGYVRRYCRNNCYYSSGKHYADRKFRAYADLMKSLTITPDEYLQLKRAFQGGFTHASLLNSGKLFENVKSFDFTSSYPYVMISENLFPMSKSKRVTPKTKEEFEKYMRLYCCVFDIQFNNIIATTCIEHPLSVAKCFNIEKYISDNGRVIKANVAKTTITEQDFIVYKKFYKWDSIIVKNMRIYKRGYLPTDFVKSILNLYVDKTTLKGVPEESVRYALSKEMLNSTYGMCVTDICKDDQIFNGKEWEIKPADIEKSIAKYNNSKNRFLFYAWGIYVTAIARKNLFTAIWECRNGDYIYSDTDSVKILNADAHKEYFDRYNNNCADKLKRATEYHKIDFEMTQPKTITGIKKPLGVWDDDGDYTRFKTLGAKRYLYETPEHHLTLTVAGLNKQNAIKYLEDRGDPFELFNDGMYIPPGYSGRNTHTYIDDYKTGEIVDYTGRKAVYEEFSGVHIEVSEYTMELTDQYLNLIKTFNEGGCY